MIKDAIDEHRGKNPDGRFWSRLVGKVKAGFAEGKAVNFHILKDLRIAQNPLAANFIFRNLTTRFDKDLHIGLEHSTTGFKWIDWVMAYRVSIIAVFIHTPELRATLKLISKDYPLTEEYSTTSLDASFTPPAFADTALVIVKCHAMRDGELITNVDAVGMDVVDVVSLA